MRTAFDTTRLFCLLAGLAVSVLLAAGCNPPLPSDSAAAGSSTPATAGTAFAEARRRMVEELRSADIRDPRVIEVMGRVPRHEFVPEAQRMASYRNSELPIDEKQTISPPYWVALMTQLLELEGTERVLEIGTGSGYQAAVLGELVPQGEVYSVEILPKLAEKASATLERLRREGVLSNEKVRIISGDGAHGHSAAAPYDAIVVTAAPRDVPTALRQQLKERGRMVIPVGDYSHQELQIIRKTGVNEFDVQVVAPASFVPLVDEDS